MIALPRWLLAVGLLLLPILFGVAFAVSRWGKAEVVVIAPADEALLVTLPGAEPATVSAGTHQVFRLTAGRHLIALARGDETLKYELEIEHAFQRWAMPAHGQCLEQREGAARRLVLHIADDSASLFDGQTFFADDPPPADIDVRKRYFMLIDAPCDR